VAFSSTDPVSPSSRRKQTFCEHRFPFVNFLDSESRNQAIFMATILSAPLGQQLVVPYINLWDVYKIRERPSRMYHWSALITSQIIVELPWNILGSSLFFVTWYFTVGFETSRAGYTYLMYGVLFPIYYTTIAQAIASTAQTTQIAGLLYSFIFSFVLIL
jgi:ATP-binding cassette subfamily G (WHITE) protein 2 (SNQ2)